MTSEKQGQAATVVTVAAALAHLKAASQHMALSADEERRAAGLLLLADLPAAGPPCAASACQAVAAAQAAVALVDIGRSTRNANVYAWAWLTCNALAQRGQAPAGCTTLAPQRWSALAPADAWAWAATAGDAQRRGDVSGVEAAMHRLAAASQWASPAVILQRHLVAALGDMSGGPARPLALMATLHLNVNMGGSWQPLLAYCQAGMDANRAQLCARLAERFLAQADNLLHLSLAIMLGERAGLDGPRLQAARQRLDAGQASLALPDAPMPLSPQAICEREHQQLRFLQRSAEVGELSALRERQASQADPGAQPR